ncbi:MAG: hypothetical protein WA364_11010 [Candidatus Nitrosopolaris sp.]
MNKFEHRCGSVTCIQKAELKTDNEQQYDEMLVHEHYLVPSRINEMKYIHCISCGTIYCQLCGKSVDARAAQHHQIDNFESV